MTKQLPPPDYDASLKALLSAIEGFLEANPSVTPADFGHRAARDTGLVERLRKGGDVTTRKWIRIISFIEDPTRPL